MGRYEILRHNWKNLKASKLVTKMSEHFLNISLWTNNVYQKLAIYRHIFKKYSKNKKFKNSHKNQILKRTFHLDKIRIVKITNQVKFNAKMTNDVIKIIKFTNHAIKIVTITNHNVHIVKITNHTKNRPNWGQNHKSCFRNCQNHESGHKNC